MKIKKILMGNGYHPDLPDEDSCSWKKTKYGAIACVADGITRDPKNSPKNMQFLPKYDSPDFRHFIKQYPKPSPAKIAADLFVKESLNFLKNKKPAAKNLLGAAKKANIKIKKWNDGNMANPNYLDRDLAGCVAIIAYFTGKNRLLFAYNSDCGIAVFDENKKLAYISPDIMLEKGKFMKIREKIDWSNPKIRIKIRKEFRNNLKFKNKECISYGAFTGEKQALSPHLLKQKELKINKNSVIILFSDGARDYFDSDAKKPDFKNLKKYLASGKYGKRERTIVAIRI